MTVTVLIAGISGTALLAGLILVGVSLARYSLGLMAGRHFAVIATVPGASWSWGLVRWYVDSDATGVIGVLALTGVCCVVMLLAFARARRRLLGWPALNGSES